MWSDSSAPFPPPLLLANFDGASASSPLLPSAAPFERREEIARLYRQRCRDPDDIHQRHVPLPSLDLPDVVPIHSGRLGELLLGETSLRPELSEAFTEQSEDLVAHS